MNKVISASDFSANSAKLLEEIEAHGETVVVTRAGRPVATISPFEQRAENPFGCMKGTFAITNPNDDLLSALDPSEIADWDKSLEVKADRLAGPPRDNGKP